MQMLVNMAWGYIKSKFSNMFNPDKLLNDSYNIAMNQGLPALITNLEEQARTQGRGEQLNHQMWQAVRSLASGGAENVVKGGEKLLNESGQGEKVMEFLKQNGQ